MACAAAFCGPRQYNRPASLEDRGFQRSALHEAESAPSGWLHTH